MVMIATIMMHVTANHVEISVAVFAVAVGRQLRNGYITKNAQ